MLRAGLIATIAALASVAPAFAQPGADDWAPFITPGDERLWTLRWRLAASREFETDLYRLNLPRLRTWPHGVAATSFVGRRPLVHGPVQAIDVRDATFVAPLQWRTASSEAYPEFLTGWVNFNAHRVATDWIGQPGGLPDLINVEWFVRIAEDDGTPLVPFLNEPERVDIDFNVPVRAHETVFDESRAMDIDWPLAWPEWTGAFRDPQAFIPSDDPFVGQLLNEWTGRAPRSMPPARLAKFLASRLIEHAQPGEDVRAFWPGREPYRGYPYVVPRTSGGPFLRGFDVQDNRIDPRDIFYSPRLREPIEDAQASAAVITNLYVALLRAADIPARVVIGVLPSEEDLARLGSGRDTLPPRGGERRHANTFRVWAEFYLWDEPAQRGQWIPVDIARQRAESSAPRPLDRPWRYFGNHDELDEIVPITSVYTANDARPLGWVPALWGWRPDPIPPFRLDPVLRFEVTGPVRRAGDPFGDIGVKRGGD